MTGLVIAILALAALAGATAPADMAAASRPGVTVKSSAYGRILFDHRGFVCMALLGTLAARAGVPAIARRPGRRTS
jgi:hypothetical protein